MGIGILFVRAWVAVTTLAELPIRVVRRSRRYGLLEASARLRLGG
jgi:hypothetical protein